MSRPIAGFLGVGNRYAFLKTLPWRSRVIILAAVFFTFGSIGFLQHMWSIRSSASWLEVVMIVLFNGVLAVGILLSVSFKRSFIPFAVAFAFGFPFLIRRMFPGSEPIATPDFAALQARLQVEGLACMAFIVAGYALFIRFIRTEGARQLRVSTEVALAERIHSALVPPIAFSSTQLDVFGMSEPSSEVGGDLLDVVQWDGHVVLCVADVSGHGVAAGSFMGMTKSAFRMRLRSPAALAAVLDDLDEVVSHLRSPGMFVTFAGIQFDGSSTADIALAGHPPILHWRKATATIQHIENPSPPLGVVDGQRHTAQRVSFEPGDLFVVLTDGLTEVHDRGQVEFGMAGVERTLERHAGAPLATVYQELLAASRAHGPQSDDQTLLLVRIR